MNAKWHYDGDEYEDHPDPNQDGQPNPRRNCIMCGAPLDGYTHAKFHKQFMDGQRERTIIDALLAPKGQVSWKEEQYENSSSNMSNPSGPLTDLRSRCCLVLGYLRHVKRYRNSLYIHSRSSTSHYHTNSNLYGRGFIRWELTIT